jgi:hypothetical protein
MEELETAEVAVEETEIFYETPAEPVAEEVAAEEPVQNSKAKAKKNVEPEPKLEAKVEPAVAQIAPRPLSGIVVARSNKKN